MTEKSVSEKPHIGMYPILSVLGSQTGEVKILNFASLPEVNFMNLLKSNIGIHVY